MRQLTPWGFRPLQVLLLAFMPIVAGACREPTAPIHPLPGTAPATSSSTLAGHAVIVVAPEDMRGWSFTHGPAAAPCHDASRCALVRGPATPPLGRGSARLAATEGSETSLAMDGFAGVRLDRVTALRYATFHEGGDIALSLRVEYDPGDQARGDAGVVVYEPALNGAEAAAGETWTVRDARAGLWWSTRQARGASAGGHPCVRARPCTWPTLLQRYPDLAIHADGGVLLTARRGRDVRGSVDALEIAVDGSGTVYDFEAELPPVNHSMATRVGAGVLADAVPADSMYPAGTVLRYAFRATAGRTAPMLILDDTVLLAPAGEIVMDRAHSLEVLTDTVYTYAALTPLERQLADLTGQLMTSANKVAAAQAINTLLMAQVRAGISAEELSRAARVADRVTIDPVRDSAAVRQIDEALAGHDFHYQYGGGQPYAWNSRGWPAFGTASSSVAAPSLSRTPPALPEDASPASMAPAGGPSTDLVPIDNPANPREQTRVVYTNGIWTARAAAFASATTIARLLYEQPRFANWYTAVTMHYNPTRSVQMQAYDRDHPCVGPLAAAAGWTPLPFAIAAFAVCKGISYATAVSSSDLIEAATARMQFELALPPTNDAVNGLARMTAAWRRQNNHVLMVGHSEGTILQAAAVQLLPALEGHPLNVANRCVAVLALAPATQRAAYAMGDHHLTGLLARNDIIRFTGATGWEEVDTPLSQQARDSLLGSTRNVLFLTYDYGMRIHQIDRTYLAPPVAPLVVSRLTTLHRECLPGAAEITLAPATVPLGASLTVSLDIRNQHNRPLLGRRTALGGWTYLFDQTGPLTFRAMVPHDRPIRIGGQVTPGLEVAAHAEIPLVTPPFSIRETQQWAWVEIGAANGPGGTGGPVPTPTGTWDGTEGGCYRRVTYTGAAGNWKEYELRCNRVYTPVYPPMDTLPTGRRITGATVWFTTPAGVTSVAPPTYYFCAGATPCVASGYLELLGSLGVVGRSAVATPQVSSSSTSITTDATTRPGAIPRPPTSPVGTRARR